MPPHGRPLDELILTVLSQSTNDRNRDVAFLRLRERFPSWEAVRDAPLEEVEEAIRPGGISKVKSARIQAILRAIGDPLSLDWIRDAPLARQPRAAVRAAGRRPQDGRLRAPVLVRAAGHPGRHARLARRDPPAPVPSGRAVRGAPRHDAQADRPARAARAPRQPAAPRPADVPCAQPECDACVLRWSCRWPAIGGSAAWPTASLKLHRLK